MMDNIQTQLNHNNHWLIESFITFIKGRDSILYYILFISSAVFYGLGIITVLTGLLLGLTPKLIFEGGLLPGEAWQVGVFIALPTAAFFVFKCATKLIIWRTFERQTSNSECGRWILGLPSVLGLEFTKDILTFCCIGVIAGSIYAMNQGMAGFGILWNSIAGLILLIVHFMYPAILSEHIRRGSNGMVSINNAVKKVFIYPRRWLMLNLIPGLFKGLIFCIILILMQYSGGFYVCMILAGLVILGLIKCIEPAFWIVWDKD